MAANTFPIYPRKPNNTAYLFGTSGAGGTISDYLGTGAVDIFASSTSDAPDGSYLRTIRCCALGVNVPTKIVLFYYQDSTHRMPMGELSMDATILDTLEPNGQSFDLLTAMGLKGGFAVKSGHKVSIGVTVTIASGFSAVSLGGDY